MPLSQYERSVMLFNLHVEMVPEGATPDPAISMEVAMRMVVDAKNGNRAQMQVGEHVDDEDDGTTRGARARRAVNRLYIKEVDWHNDGVITLLLHHGDTAAADPALINLENGDVRTAGKKDTEAVGHAAHLLIACGDHQKTKSGQWRAILERVPNIGRSTSVEYLNRVLRNEASIERLSFIDENKNSRRCHPKIISHSQMSHGLRRDLEGGKLSRVEFITRAVEDGFEEDDIVEVQSRILAHKIIKPPAPSAVMGLVERLRSWGRNNGYEEMQLHFSRARDQKHLSPRMATELEDAEDLVYSRLYPIEDFDKPLDQCPTRIVEEMQQKMRAMFHIEECWT